MKNALTLVAILAFSPICVLQGDISPIEIVKTQNVRSSSRGTNSPAMNSFPAEMYAKPMRMENVKLEYDDLLSLFPGSRRKSSANLILAEGLDAASVTIFLLQCTFGVYSPIREHFSGFGVLNAMEIGGQ